MPGRDEEVAQEALSLLLTGAAEEQVNDLLMNLTAEELTGIDIAVEQMGHLVYSAIRTKQDGMGRRL